jgi:hypothetical protein
MLVMAGIVPAVERVQIMMNDNLKPLKKQDHLLCVAPMMDLYDSSLLSIA